MRDGKGVGMILLQESKSAMRKIVSAICIICMIIMYVNAFADADIEDQEEAVVTLVWDDSHIDIDATEWDGRSVLISTEDAGLGNGKIYDFVGVKLSDLMELAGADDCTGAIVKSIDGMTSEIFAEDIRNYDIALVNGYNSGKPLKVDAGGPLKIVFPITEHPELKDTYSVRSWVWYVTEVEFVRQSANAFPTEPVGQPDNAISEESVSQPVNAISEESAKQPDNAPSGESVNQPVNEPSDESAKQPVNTSSESFGHADKCIIIVLDAFSSSYLTQLGPNSNLSGISEKGASCLTARSIYPSHTCSNHATIMTGVGTARHGIVGNNRLGEDGMSSVKNIQPEMIQVPTLFQMASAAGKKTAIVSGKDNLVTLFSGGLDIGISNKRLTEYLSVPPELTDSTDNDEYYRFNMELANWVFDALFTVLKEENPDLTMVNIQSTDYIAHRFGPGSEEMTECIRAVDEELGELYLKMENAGMLEDTAVIVTADHGMTSSDKAIPLIALSTMNFPTAGAVIDGRNGYIWYGKEEKEAVIQFFENIEGIRNVFERESDEAVALNVDFTGGPDLFLETEPGYVFLVEPMIDLYHGQHGSRDDSDTIVPIICFGAGIPSGTGIEPTDLRCIAPLVCHLMDLPSGDFDFGTPVLLETQDRAILVQ